MSRPLLSLLLVALTSTAAHADALAPAPALGAPRIHIASDFPITLHEVVPFIGDQIICQAPCAQIVDGRAGQQFYFAGDEIPATPCFPLAEKSGDVVATVHKGNFALLTTGHALMAPAILNIVAGGVLAPFMALERDANTALNLQYAMGATIGVGAALLVTSVVMIVEGKTRFRFDRL
jgi:hypothetical protein